jgi:hypothetical protein
LNSGILGLYIIAVCSDFFVLFVHVIATLVLLSTPRGFRSAMAESAMLRHQLLIRNRGRKRAANLGASDRIIATMLTALAAFLAVFIDPSFTSAQEAFEITSVKPFSPAAGRGARGGAAETTSSACVARPQVSPGRLQFSGATVHGLIASAYGTSCLLVSGGPAWMKSDRFEVQALRHEGPRSWGIGHFNVGIGSSVVCAVGPPRH